MTNNIILENNYKYNKKIIHSNTLRSIKLPVHTNIVIRLGSSGMFIVAINDGYYFITGNFNYNAN